MIFSRKTFYNDEGIKLMAALPTNSVTSTTSLSAVATAAAAQSHAKAKEAAAGGNVNQTLRTAATAEFVLKECTGENTPANRPIAKSCRFTFGMHTDKPFGWTFHMKSTAKGNKNAFSVPFVVGQRTPVKGSKILVPNKEIEDKLLVIQNILLLKQFLADPASLMTPECHPRVDEFLTKWNEHFDAIEMRDKLKEDLPEHTLLFAFIIDPKKPMPDFLKKAVELNLVFFIKKSGLPANTDFSAKAKEYEADLKSNTVSKHLKDNALCKRVLGLPDFESIPGYNVTSILPVEESTGLAPYHPAVDVENEELIFKLAFDDAGTQLGAHSFDNNGKVTEEALPVQGRNPKNNYKWSDWLFNPISSADMESIEKENPELADKISKNGLNILMFKAKRIDEERQTKSLDKPKSAASATASASVGITTGGYANPQNYVDCTYQGRFRYVENSAIFIKVSGIACQAISANGNATKTPSQILQLADDVTQAGDKALSSKG